jgi:hypothetical protein
MLYTSSIGYKYTLAKDYSVPLYGFHGVSFAATHFSVEEDGVLTVKAGYAWDGASGPTWDTRDTLTPTLVHDALYQAIRTGMLPEDRRFDVDLEFYRLMRERTSSALGHFRAFYFFAGVRLFGWLAIRPHKYGEAQDNILTAP